MEFCKFCDNMLYIKDSEENKFNVKYYCKNCHFEKQLSEQSKTKLIIQNKYNADIPLHNVLNKNIIFDPTIPHIDNIKCPNKDCCKKPDEQNDIMYIKTNAIDLSFVYYCVYCNHFWENKN